MVLTYFLKEGENSSFHKVLFIIWYYTKETLSKDFFSRGIFFSSFFRVVVDFCRSIIDFTRIKSVSDGFSRELFITILIADEQ